MMVSDGNECTEGTSADLELGANSNASEIREYIHFGISSGETKLLDPRSQRRRPLDCLKARPSTDWFKKLRLSSPYAIFWQNVDEREETSLSVPSPVSTQRHFIRKIKWASLANIFKEWIIHPMNIALLIWLTCVTISASMLGLLLLGLLDNAFPTKSSRNHWIEINNQVLNALFTLMSLYQHPNLFHHIVLLCRWRPGDIIELRKTYCKNGAYRPHEWAHMMLVLVLLHVTCFAQYVLCGLYWGYSRAERPELAENFFVALGTTTPIIAGAYAVYSPLGREYDSGSDEESQGQVSSADIKQFGEVELKLYERRVVVSRPEWVGGLLDCRDDLTVGYLSFFCTFCIFGWNMERLGFGNMYVHIVTFLLLCLAPFWIFNISALRIHDEVIGDMVGIAGIVLCVFGLLYGGFWRIQMRKRFKLPGNTFCCGSASLTDYVQWMFCWACSLAQEVRTGNFYDVEDDSVYRKHGDGDGERHTFLPPLPCEGGLSPVIGSQCHSPLPKQSSNFARDDSMAPPVQPLIELEGRGRDGGTVATTQFTSDTDRR